MQELDMCPPDRCLNYSCVSHDNPEPLWQSPQGNVGLKKCHSYRPWTVFWDRVCILVVVPRCPFWVIQSVNEMQLDTLDSYNDCLISKWWFMVTVTIPSDQCRAENCPSYCLWSAISADSHIFAPQCPFWICNSKYVWNLEEGLCGPLCQISMPQTAFSAGRPSQSLNQFRKRRVFTYSKKDTGDGRTLKFPNVKPRRN